MTDEEKYLFDLQGYLVIENAIEPEALAAMNTWIDAQAEKDTRFYGQPGNDHIENVLTWAPEFRSLLDNPRVLPYLKEILGDTLRLDHDYAIFLQPGGKGMRLHQQQWSRRQSPRPALPTLTRWRPCGPSETASSL